jgi:RNA polymerase sigma-70 factor (ECF subfamily)
MDQITIDKEIKAALKAGRTEALKMIWDAYSNDLLGYVISIVCSRAEAEDILQDCFVTIARKHDRVAKAINIKPYIFSMARNMAMNRIRKQSTEADHRPTLTQWLEQSVPESAIAGDSNEVPTALAALPEEQRTVIVMKFYSGMTFKEISALMGISENTAASRYRYGMEKLRIELDTNNDE